MGDGDAEYFTHPKLRENLPTLQGLAWQESREEE